MHSVQAALCCSATEGAYSGCADACRSEAPSHDICCDQTLQAVSQEAQCRPLMFRAQQELSAVTYRLSIFWVNKRSRRPLSASSRIKLCAGVGLYAPGNSSYSISKLNKEKPATDSCYKHMHSASTARMDSSYSISQLKQASHAIGISANTASRAPAPTASHSSTRKCQPCNHAFSKHCTKGQLPLHLRAQQGRAGHVFRHQQPSTLGKLSQHLKAQESQPRIYISASCTLASK